jgi:hypothetical protein
MSPWPFRERPSDIGAAARASKENRLTVLGKTKPANIFQQRVKKGFDFIATSINRAGSKWS